MLYQKKRAAYHVYILLCGDGTYYTGYTNNLATRLRQHHRGRGARYTRTRTPTRIVHVERFRTRRAAMRRERQIKSLTHEEKRDLVSHSQPMTNRIPTRAQRRRTSHSQNRIPSSFWVTGRPKD